MSQTQELSENQEFVNQATLNHIKLLNLAARASVVTAVLLVIIKVIAVYMTNSVSVTASLIDSVMDIGASLVNLIAVRYALLPPDDNHRFGHGKAEPLAALAQSAFICGSALFLIFHATERFITPTGIKNINVGVIVMMISMVATSVLVLIQRFVIKRTQSTVIKADSLHYVTDLLANLSILIALGLVHIGIGQVDTLIGIALGVYILYCAFGIGREAVDMLMDKELTRDEIDKIYDTVLNHDGILGAHDLRTRQSGKDTFIQLHLELDDNMPLIEAHAIADTIEESIVEQFPHSDVLIHQDPIGMVNDGSIHERRIKKKSAKKKKLKKNDNKE